LPPLNLSDAQPDRRFVVYRQGVCQAHGRHHSMRAVKLQIWQ
jgi:hypothetical protein